jgi:hypothetical protein
MKPTLIIPLLILLAIACSCTYTITMAHTSGTATDLIDETQSVTPKVSTQISGIPGV